MILIGMSRKCKFGLCLAGSVTVFFLGHRNEILRYIKAGTFLTKVETVAVSEMALIDVFSHKSNYKVYAHIVKHNYI
jgi:hypothetical protein